MDIEQQRIQNQLAHIEALAGSVTFDGSPTSIALADAICGLTGLMRELFATSSYLMRRDVKGNPQSSPEASPHNL